MNRKALFPSVLLLTFLGLLLSLTAGKSQIDSSGRFTPEMQQIAKDILQSPAAAYLSGTGRNALEHVAGQLPVPQGLRRAQALQSRMPTAALPLAPAVPGAEVMVNNPALDTFELFDISTQSETAVAGFGSSIVVAYNNSATFPPSVMGYSLSTDGGLTFTDLRGLPGPTGGNNLGDPGLVADRAGNFYASSIASDRARPAGFAFTIGISKSTDGGSTFSIPVSPPAAGVLPGSFQDKEFIAVDTSRGPFDGNVYVTWTSFGAPFTKLPILFSRSTDGGATFSTPIQISTSTEFDQGSEPVVGPNGEIYVAWERFFDLANLSAPPAIVVAKSTNGGMSFGSPVVVTPVTDIGFGAGTMLGNFRVNSFPRIDVSPTTGTVYIVFASNPQSLPPTPPTGDSGDVFFTRSTDGGANWAVPTKLNDDITVNDQFFPDIAVNGNGVLEVFWYDRRNDPANLMIDLFETRSADDGVSFTPNAQVNAVSFPPAVGYDPLINRIYMGDYIDIKAITTSTGRGMTFLMAWGDNRRSVATFGGTRHDQDVFFTKD
jgi:hypothetical protein